jgi:hypothetical protein
VKRVWTASRKGSKALHRSYQGNTRKPNLKMRAFRDSLNAVLGLAAVSVSCFAIARDATKSLLLRAISGDDRCVPLRLNRNCGFDTLRVV